jgi:nucleoside-diphosphate-sugar epimerase
MSVKRGANVFVEKPIAFQASEVVQLYREAHEYGVQLCPDFVQLFHPTMLQAIDIVRSGTLGKVIHCECNYGFAIEGALVESVGEHWAYGLPGGVFRNHMTHPLYLVGFWIGRFHQIHVLPKSFGTFSHGSPDHLEITLAGEEGTGHITLTAAARPADYFIKICCSRGSITVNFRTMTKIVEPHGIFPGAVERLTAGVRQAFQLSSQFFINSLSIATGRLIPYEGLAHLIPQYYNSIVLGRQPPISEGLAVAVSEAEDAVVQQLPKVNSRPSPRTEIRSRPRFVVTGATGFLGKEVVRVFAEQGYRVRALVRPQSRTDDLERMGADLAYGDVRDVESLRGAFSGASTVIHLAAGTHGSRGFMLESCVTGTANVADAARETGIERVIYTSSASVYDFSGLKEGSTLTEQSPLDDQPELRGTYTQAKRRAEQIAMAELRNQQTRWSILRPAVIFGKGHVGASIVGVQFGPCVFCFGRSTRQLRLIHVTDVAKAILDLCNDPSTAGEIFNVAHADRLTNRHYVKTCLVQNGARSTLVFYIPHTLMAFVAFILRTLHRVTTKAPNLSSGRVAYLCRGIRLGSDRIIQQTAWRPSEPLSDQLFASAQLEKTRSPWDTSSISQIQSTPEHQL